MKRCGVSGCEGIPEAKGFCFPHYQRHINGRPLEAPFPPNVRGRGAAERLSARIVVDAETGCHVWKGTRSPQGYGRIRDDSKVIQLTHRLAWTLARGPIPVGMLVLHRCDNPPCCNPAHLFLGTYADNARDRGSKGRGKGARARDLERYRQWR